jgi:hypothetical protein
MKLFKRNGANKSSADMNESHTNCAEHTKVCVQKDFLFGLVDLLSFPF